MVGHDEPENKQVASLGAFVAQPALCKESSRPAAGRFEQVQGAFGGPPVARPRLLFVPRVCEVGDERNNRRHSDEQPKGELRGEAKRGKRRGDEQNEQPE